MSEFSPRAETTKDAALRFAAAAGRTDLVDLLSASEGTLTGRDAGLRSLFLDIFETVDVALSQERPRRFTLLGATLTAESERFAADLFLLLGAQGIPDMIEATFSVRRLERTFDVAAGTINEIKTYAADVGVGPDNLHGIRFFPPGAI